MDGLDRLDEYFLGSHGDRHEREFWPLLSNRFPSYEILWRRLIVPLTWDVRCSPHRQIIEPMLFRDEDNSDASFAFCLSRPSWEFLDSSCLFPGGQSAPSCGSYS